MDPISLSLIMAGSQIGLGTMSAIKQKEAAEQQQDITKQQASLYRQQGDLARQDYELQAKQKEEEVKRFETRQRLSFLKNGVLLEGSPIMTLNETISKGQEEIQALINKGISTQGLYNQQSTITLEQGRWQEKQIKSQANSMLMGTIMSAGGGLASAGAFGGGANQQYSDLLAYNTKKYGTEEGTTLTKLQYGSKTSYVTKAYSKGY